MTPKPLRLKPNILVWDLPVRLFHWLLALSFAGAWITAESERWRLLHVTLGYTLGGLLAFRVLWGLVGTRHARFSDFVRGPRAALRYLGGLLRGRPEPHVGHNPAGALAIVALMALGGLIVASGWANYNALGGDLMEELHEALASTMLTVVGVHVLAVMISSRLHHENLVGAMITGRKHGAPGDGITQAWRSVAALMLVAVIGFWTWQWQGAPQADMASAEAGGPAVLAQQHGRRHGDDDDDD
ncbi:MAG: cytochrome B [Burkholderiales bacterium RIFCSPHIGHO2_12_FULL_69_20]|nr:MAG: cytochrome B [Burkholderiales bacterium RIFCSPHIGHO2_12_FULL_69_20]